MKEIDDQILLQRIKGGDLSAFTTIFKKYAPILCTYAYSLVKDEDMANDVVQHIFTDFLAKQNYRKIGSNLKYYLYVSVYHRSLRTLEEERKRQERNIAFQYTKPNKELPTVEKLDGEIERQQLLEKLKSVMDDLPPQRRQALQLVHIHGYKYTEVAAVMGVSINTVKTHVRIAMEGLRNFFNCR